MVRSRLLWAAGLALTLSLGTAARADLFTYDLSIPNSAVNSYPGPYGTVKVDLTDSTHATVTLDATNQGTYTYGFGDGGTLGLNVSGNFTGSVFSWINLVGSSTPTNAGAGNEDGFGNFNYTVNNGAGAADSLSELVVKLTATNGNSWADATSVLTLNNKDFFTAAHLFVYATPPTDQSHTALDTGYVGNGTGAPPVVPEPSSMAIAGLGALGFLAYRLRRRAK